MDWLEEVVVLAIHEAQIAEHGGPTGLRDRSILLSALARPQNVALYAKPDVPQLAALYALAIIQSHPFVDGNKRVGTVLLETFLQLHNFELLASDAELVATIVGDAAGSVSEERFIDWVRENVAPLV